ncbi:sugar phosphate isomerase/epimerase family protein [Microbacterium gorillae]|uniref:sugar phosphate isomerase/epimerase family protein n=1 Tax=Microbacterium gorillae TaxID=1231063 RepID=UPI00058B8B5A|nr:TIM barrel protein [Microbacterium gorillae]
MSDTHTRARWSLSGFGDEIDADPRVQCAVLAALGARHVEVRSAWGGNIVELDDAQLAELAEVLRDADMKVSAIASPIGKTDLSAPLEIELARLDRALIAAERLGTRYVRIFSFWQNEATAPADMRDDVLAASREFARRAEAAGIVLLHENEKNIYGDIPERVHDLVTSVDSPAYRLAWDNANFVQVGVSPFTDGWGLLGEYVDYLQVKDARLSDGTVVPAGAGDGELAETIAALRDRGFDGFASLEPHLAASYDLGGFTGPSAFGVAARAFRSLTDQAGVELV